jgi:hypothetical protein
MNERRREPRQRSLLGATISFGRRQCAMDCVVRNISAGGAMLAFAHSAITPRQFSLTLPRREETYSARVIWRRHDRLGVALSPAETADVPIEPAERIRTLEAENRRLRDRLDPR